MKAVILAGGLGTRLAEETSMRPKPMVEIGGRPILWHIMKIYESYGIDDFVVLGGYKVEMIKDYFLNYVKLNSDIICDMKNNSFSTISSTKEKWRVTILDTGISTMTGGRLARAKRVIGEAPFLLTYGDGVGDIDIGELIKFHQSQGAIVTLTSAQPSGRFGALEIGENNRVERFREKPRGDGSWINAGFMVCSPEFFDYLSDSAECILEQEPLMKCARDGGLYTYKHRGFWMPMDTLRDKEILEDQWNRNNAKWKVW